MGEKAKNGVKYPDYLSARFARRFFPPFSPNTEPGLRLSFGVGGNIFKTEISLKEWTKGFEGWASGKSGKIRYQLFFLGLICRSHVAGHRSMCECILSPDR